MHHWAPHLVTLLLDSNDLSTELLLSYLLSNGRDSDVQRYYHRVDATLDEYIPLDDPAMVPQLIELAN